MKGEENTFRRVKRKKGEKKRKQKAKKESNEVYKR